MEIVFQFQINNILVDDYHYTKKKKRKKFKHVNLSIISIKEIFSNKNIYNILSY